MTPRGVLRFAKTNTLGARSDDVRSSAAYLTLSVDAAPDMSIVAK